MQSLNLTRRNQTNCTFNSCQLKVSLTDRLIVRLKLTNYNPDLVSQLGYRRTSCLLYVTIKRWLKIKTNTMVLCHSTTEAAFSKTGGSCNPV